MIIEKVGVDSWKLSDGHSAEVIVPISDLIFLHQELEEALDKDNTEKVTFTYYDITSARRAMASVNMALALWDLGNDYRAWQKYGDSDTVDLEKLRDNYFDTLNKYHLNLDELLM